MAKKNFKKGIGSLIQDSFRNQENESQDAQKNQEVEKLQKQIQDLKAQIKLQEDELHKWRTGKLTVEKFHESLKKYDLKYKPEENSFKAIK